MNDKTNKGGTTTTPPSEPQAARESRRPQDPELAAMSRITSTLCDLDMAAIRRVLDYLNRRFYDAHMKNAEVDPPKFETK